MKCRVSLLALACALAGCEKRAPDEVVRPPEAAQPADDGPPDYVPPGGDGDDAHFDGGTHAGQRDAGTAMRSDAGSDGPGPAPTISKAALLAAISACSLETYRELEERSDALVSAAKAWSAQPDPQRLDAARDAFVLTMDSFEEVEVFRFGPLARSSEPGGQGLRDRMYAFPLRSACKIDQQIVNRAYAAADFEASALNARGLGAFEYLAYHGESSNACGSIIDINHDGTWAMLSASELMQRRADYALAVAKQVQKHAQALHTAWQPSGGNFARELAQAGHGSATFANAQAALNAVSDGLFYIEKEVKDYKLGWPLGLVPECLTSTCPEAVEAPYAKISNRQIARNLLGFRRLFQGCGSGYAGLGFDDWLVEVGAADLSARMLDALSATEDYARDMDPPIEQAIVSDTAKVSTLHTRLKVLTDLMKTEFVSVLNLDPPAGVEGDND